MKAEHFAANGFYVNHCTRLPDEEPRRRLRALLRALRLPLRRRAHDPVGRLRQRRLRVLHRRDAVPEAPGVVHGRPRHRLRERPRLLGHELQVRDDPQLVSSTTTARAWSRTRWSPSPISRPTRGIIENNLIFWNNFDYYRPSSPVKTVSGGVGTEPANYPIGAGVILFGTTNWTVKNNSDLRQLPVGRRGLLGPDQHHRQGAEHRQPHHEQQDGRRVQGRQRVRLLQRRIRQGDLLPEQRGQRDRGRRGERRRRRRCTRRARTPTAPAPRRATRISSRKLAARGPGPTRRPSRRRSGMCTSTRHARGSSPSRAKGVV